MAGGGSHGRVLVWMKVKLTSVTLPKSVQESGLICERPLVEAIDTQDDNTAASECRPVKASRPGHVGG